MIIHPTPRLSRLQCGLRFASLLGTGSVLLALTACGDDSDPLNPVEIRTLSTRPDLVSGGDALVEIVTPAGTDATGLCVKVGDRDVTSAFASRADGRITGLVSGLAAARTCSSRR